MNKQQLRQLRQRLLLYQTALWLAAVLAVPVGLAGVTAIFRLEPFSPLWNGFAAILLLGTIVFCGYLHAQLARKRRASDPAHYRGSVDGSTAIFILILGIVILVGGAALFIAIVTHAGC